MCIGLSKHAYTVYVYKRGGGKKKDILEISSSQGKTAATGWENYDSQLEFSEGELSWP